MIHLTYFFTWKNSMFSMIIFSCYNDFTPGVWPQSPYYHDYLDTVGFNKFIIRKITVIFPQLFSPITYCILVGNVPLICQFCGWFQTSFQLNRTNHFPMIMMILKKNLHSEFSLSSDWETNNFGKTYMYIMTSN